MTLTELSEMWEAFIVEENRKNDLDYLRTAWAVSYLMNATGNMKSRVTPEKLLGKEFFAKGNVNSQEITTKEQAREALNKLKQRFKRT